MAELLIKAVDATHPDPIKNERGCYKRGDIVDVRPDGWHWGTEEGLPKFVIVKVPGLDPERVKHAMEPHHDLSDAENPKMIRRRKWNLDSSVIPQGIRAALFSTGSLTITPAQLRSFVRNIIEPSETL